MESANIPRGHIEDVGVLNLLSAKSPEDFRVISRIEDVGAILVPRSLATALLEVPMEDVGTIVPVPEGDDVVLINGQTTTTGEALAAGDPERTLVVVGQIIVEGVVAKVGYKGVHLYGQMIAPRGSETALGVAMREMSGQVLYVPEGSRMVMGEETFERAYLEALPRPTPFVVFGAVEFADDVDADLLRRTIPEIVLFGAIRAPRPLVPLLKVLTLQKFGEIQAKG